MGDGLFSRHWLDTCALTRCDSDPQKPAWRTMNGMRVLTIFSLLLQGAVLNNWAGGGWSPGGAGPALVWSVSIPNAMPYDAMHRFIC